MTTNGGGFGNGQTAVAAPSGMNIGGGVNIGGGMNTGGGITNTGRSPTIEDLLQVKSRRCPL